MIARLGKGSALQTRKGLVDYFGSELKPAIISRNVVAEFFAPRSPLASRPRFPGITPLINPLATKLSLKSSKRKRLCFPIDPNR